LEEIRRGKQKVLNW